MGPEVSCEDEPGHNTEGDCEGLGGIYHGGVRCDDYPCRVCPFDDPEHCHPNHPDGYIIAVDRAFGLRGADDFRPAGDTIQRICWTAGFRTVGGAWCGDRPPPDAWEVTFYEDLDGLPDIENVIAGPMEIQIDAKHLRGR